MRRLDRTAYRYGFAPRQCAGACEVETLSPIVTFSAQSPKWVRMDGRGEEASSGKRVSPFMAIE